MNIKVGDKVKVKRGIIVVQEGETGLWGKEAEVVVVDDFCFPVELKFDDSKVQEHYEGLGKRRFDFCELHKLG
ncbi:hypothetical protein [Paenibacillus elgii]|uniref:hypothetical protein n=1 Tax=Paenibacillus elgii TaxID=189691 RepID=UPI000248C6CA|nr:hypothetical protein [Paenibacillus elgii]